jgi:putative protein-disulfide isomerase
MKLHYIFDPLCGWCYAVAPLVDAARALPELSVAFHAGGMLAGSNRRPITPQWRDYVMPHDERIAALSGQPFGAAYFEGLLRDTTAIMDSEPPITAILAAEALDGRGLDMIHRQQRAHYEEGRRIADHDVLVSLAVELGLDAQAFTAEFERASGKATHDHIAASRALLARTGARGFPTFAVERADGALAVIDVGQFIGHPDTWTALLQRVLQDEAGARGAAQRTGQAADDCADGSCALPGTD